jgi:ELWxxDGT repeat protein
MVAEIDPIASSFPALTNLAYVQSLAERPQLFDDGRFLFGASAGQLNFEPHVSDGTAAGTNLIMELNPAGDGFYIDI